MSKYKLIEELGLKVEIGMKVKKRQKRIGFVDVVSADELERLLEDGPIITEESIPIGKTGGELIARSKKLLGEK